MWLGIDHGFGFSSVPIIFETMAFPPEEWREEKMDRYATEGAAVQGHYEILFDLLDEIGADRSEVDGWLAIEAPKEAACLGTAVSLS